MPTPPEVPVRPKPPTIAQGRGSASPASGAGQPAKLTPKSRRRFLAALRRGHHLSSACDIAEIGTATFRAWMARGAKDTEDSGDLSSPYAEFRAAVLATTAQAEDDLVKTFHKAGKKDWQASKEFLARRWPKRWGAKINGEGDIGPSLIVPLQIIFRTLPPGYDPVEADKRAAIEAEGGVVEPTPLSPGTGSLEGFVEPKVALPPPLRVPPPR